MAFLPECGADKMYIISDSNIPTHLWIHNDSMYVRLGGIRNTKTWSKSRDWYYRCVHIVVTISTRKKIINVPHYD